MNRRNTHALIPIVGLIAIGIGLVSTARGQGRWYRHPYPRTISSVPADAQSVPIDWISFPEANPARLMPPARCYSDTVCHFGGPTNALIRVSVDDLATVWVNGHATEPPDRARTSPGNRSIVIAGIPPGGVRDCSVSATMATAPNENVTLTKNVRVQAGRIYYVRFLNSEFHVARPTRRVSRSLLVLYDFKNRGRPNMIQDISGVGSPLDLLVSNPTSVIWKSDGLQVHADVLIQSGQTAEKIRTAVQKSREITIEAWVTPASTRVVARGPTCIVGLSNGTTGRRFTLDQHDTSYAIRLGTAGKRWAMRSLRESVSTQRTQVVFTCDGSRTAKLFFDGRPFSRDQVPVDFAAWKKDSHLFLVSEANEHKAKHAWQGTYHLLAIYGRALDESEVLNNYQAGP